MIKLGFSRFSIARVRRRWQRQAIYALGVSMFVWLTGCTTTSQVPDESQVIGFTGQASGRGQDFLVCAFPSSEELKQRQDQVAAIEKRTLSQDLATQNHPTFNVPRRYTLLAEDLREAARPDQESGPVLQIHTLRLRRTDVAKKHRTVFHREGTQSPRISTQEVFVLEEWNDPRADDFRPGTFPPPQASNETIFVHIDQLREGGGHIHSGSGRADNGIFTFNLKPYLEMGAEAENGLRLRFNTATNLFCIVEIPQEAFLAYLERPHS